MIDFSAGHIDPRPGVNKRSRGQIIGRIGIDKRSQTVSLLLSLLVERTITLESLLAATDHLNVEHAKFWNPLGGVSFSMHQ